MPFFRPILRVWILSFLLALNSPCVDILSLTGLSDVQCRHVEDTFKRVEKPCLSFLWKTFGASTTCPERLLTKRPDFRVRIYSINATCHHGGRRCGRDEPDWKLRDPHWPSVSPAIRARVREVGDFIRRYPHIQFTVIPALEDDWTYSAWVNNWNLHKRILPRGVTYVRSQMHFPFRSPPHITTELHIPTASHTTGECYLNNDGERLFAGLDERRDGQIAMGRMHIIRRRAAHFGCADYGLWIDTAQGSFLYKSFVYPRRRALEFNRYHARIINKFLRSTQ